jgi:DNA-binding transcriptional regulator YhcF (GntR family)
MSTGWVKIHRKLVDWEWYNDVNTTRVFLHLLIIANHKNKSWRGIEVKRGQRLTSVSKLAKEVNLSERNVRTAIKHLKSTNEVTSYSSAQHTVFTIVNYESYQEVTSEVTNGRQTSDKQVTTNKNDKNDKNVNKDIHQQIADMWNTSFTELPNIKKLTSKRKSHINAVIKEFGNSHGLNNPERWNGLFEYISTCDFLMGRSNDWRCDFDFVINKNNLLKIIEGKYENTRTQA